MKLSRTAIKELTAAYRAVLKHALVASMGLAMIAPAVAAETLKDGSEFKDKEITGSINGALVVSGGAKNVIIEDVNIHDNSRTKGAAIDVIKNAQLSVKGSKLENNTATPSYACKNGLCNGGAINLGTGSHLTLDSITVNGNKAKQYGGGIYADNDTITDITQATFTNNSADFFGAVSSSKINSVLNITNSTFENNFAGAGGAVGAFSKTDIDTVTFTGNYTTDERDIADGGGAIFLGAESQSTIKNSIFTDNKTLAQGGAIATRQAKDSNNENAMLFIDGSTFLRNTATKTGGALDNYFYKGNADNTDAVYISQSTFESNSAELGGAVYNHGEKDKAGNVASIKIVGSTFGKIDKEKGNTGNLAVNGGAIYNAGIMTIDKSVFESNTAVNGGAIMAYGAQNYSVDSDLAHLTITNSSFKGNVASDKEKGQALGGAIVAGRNSLVDIQNSVFEDNIADYAGAIFSYSSGSGSKGGMLNISGSTFKKNTALGAGAVQLMAESTVKNTKFVENKATIDTDGGGAVFVGAVGKVKMDNVAFIQNEAEKYRGGAISTRSADLANNKDARLDILNSSFMRNTAGTTGGAIDNFLYSSAQDETAVYIDNSKFLSNNADMGGAVYNHGDKDKGGSTASLKISNSIFTGNKAKTNGGAIYNEKHGGITLEGTNMFSGNTSGATGTQVGNDIHNLGEVNIRAGETTFASGVSGTGTLTVADGATMNIGTAMIEQGTLNIDGVVLASIVDSRSHGRLYADNYNIGENGVLKLNVGAVGTYSIFKENATNMNIDAGAAYVATQNADGTVLIETKALEDLSADTGLSVKAAGVVAGLANSGDRSLSMLSLRVQNALDAGHTDYIEQEAGKLNPTEKPVAHSVASSVQNQIMNTVTNRMAALGAVGRNGGDVNAGYGLWAHGLINKSKYGSQFHGTTRGTAIGLDALINRAFTIGAGYAYASIDMHSRDRTTDIDSNTLFVYGQYKPAKGYVNGALNYTKSKYQENIKAFDMGIASDHDVFVYGGQVMTGYDFSVGLTPEAGVRYLHISQDDYSNGLARVKGTDSNFVTGTAGMKYSFLIQDTGKTKWRPELRAAATYDFVSDDTAVTVTMPGAAPYVVDGDRLSRFGGEFGLGLSIECPGLTLALSYDLDLHEDYTSQTGMAKLKLMF